MAENNMMTTAFSKYEFLDLLLKKKTQMNN